MTAPIEIQKMIDDAIRKERGRAARQLRNFINARFQDSHPNNKPLDVWTDRTFTYYDMLMVAKQMQFKEVIGRDEI